MSDRDVSVNETRNNKDATGERYVMKMYNT